MKTFEAFKASREKMDSSTRSMSDRQWQQAYAAYRSSRERVGASSNASVGEGGLKRRRSGSGSDGGSSGASGGASGTHAPSTLSGPGLLKVKVRAESAYADLRLVVNVIAWVLVGVVLLQGIIAVFVAISMLGLGAGVLAMLSPVIPVLVIIILRMLIHVIIDIPDIALYRESAARKSLE